MDTPLIADIRARLKRHEAWMKKIAPRRSYRTEEQPENARVTNEERSVLEVFDFVQNPPEKYFVYIRERQAITWMGDVLGEVTFGRESRSNMGDKRVPITMMGINGKVYYGTYFKSAGDYARIKMKKGK